MVRSAHRMRRRRLPWVVAALVVAVVAGIGMVVGRQLKSVNEDEPARVPRGTVSQVTRVYACIMPTGGPARVWAYGRDCPGGQLVSWEVEGVLYTSGRKAP
jgi:hypothetical protein